MQKHINTNVMAWNWLGAGTTPRSTYKSSLPFLPTISRNRQAEEFRENLQTGNAEYGSFWGIDFAQRSNPIRRQSDFVETSSRDWRGGAAWSRMRAGPDEYLNDLHNTLQGAGLEEVTARGASITPTARSAIPTWRDPSLRATKKIH